MPSTYSTDEPYEDDELNYAGDYLDVRIPFSSYAKKGLKVRRLVCRVCKLKFRTRQETQAHIKREHRRFQA
jgi:hypothetical protein